LKLHCFLAFHVGMKMKMLIVAVVAGCILDCTAPQQTQQITGTGVRMYKD